MGRNKKNQLKINVDGNGLRPPSQVEIETNGYPTSPQDAAKKGFNRYVNDQGVLKQMRFRSKAKSGSIVEGLKIEVEDANKRKRDKNSYRAYKRGQSLREKDYVEVFGKDVGKPIFRQERDAKETIRQSRAKDQQTDHFKALSKGGIDGSRNLGNIDAFKNMSQGNRRKLTQFQERSLGIEATTRHDYIGTNGPWATQEMNEKIISGELTESSAKPKLNSKKLFRNLSSVAGQSNNPIANVSGDLIGAVIDGVSYIGDPSRERAIDVLLSTGQAATSLVAVGLSLVPIPGARPGAYALMKIGDNIGKAERIWNMAREGAMRDTKVRRGGAIDPWKIK
tara:strand:- start:150 stop:1160 length:1011 start_codon:yes stop_codon:yes gene_type:complete